MVHALAAGRQSYSGKQRCAAPFDFAGNARTDGYGWDISVRGHGSKHLETGTTQHVLIVVAEESGLDIELIDENSTPLSLGLDSLESAALMQTLEEKFGVDLSECDMMTRMSRLAEICG